jgi:two-component system, chemotaxis family, sensor kinase CheA
MANVQPISAPQKSATHELRAQIQEAAVKYVMGDLDCAQRRDCLTRIREEAQAAGREDVAKVAAEALDAVSFATNPDETDACFSNCTTRMQQMLGESEAELPSAEPATIDQMPRAPVAASSPSPLGEDRELLGDFILECRDHLAQVEMQMITVEKEPGDSEAIHTVFRAFHTVKGLASFLDLGDIRDVAHETETLLDLARNHKLAITPAVVDVVLAAADFLKVWLVRVEMRLTGNDAGPVPEREPLLKRIRLGATGDPGSGEVTPQPRTIPESAVVAAREELPKPAAEWSGPERRSCNDRRTGEERRAQAAEGRSLKVDTAKLDHLVDMAGELAIAESMVRHHPELAALRSPSALHSLTQLARITSDLQKTAMSMRMVPIGGLFQRMNRLVRDLVRRTGKQAEMEATGGDTELDRNVVEELADPLMHMVRNAVDHGLESAEERLAAGKEPVGHIRLRAFHQAGHIVIEISDDGRGLHREAILEKAQRTGLIKEGSSLSDREVFEFILHPGFSTAAEVTDISGRGVGMDVVKRRIQKLRGHLEIESTPGRGTLFSLRLPLTLAMIDGLVVGIGSERYVIPIFSVREMLRPTEDMVFTIEGRQEMALVRDTLLPVVRLYERFEIRPRSENPMDGLLIVAEAAGKPFCLMVDDLIGKHEVVIKSLGETLKDIPGVAGGAILGDGRVGLILDLEGIFHGSSK